jgi:Reverse transcriptase (RNA-dependent DNA polymerase)
VFLDTVKKLFLTQHVDFNTRGRGTDTPHILDIVLTDHPLIDRIDRLAPIGKSDHCVMVIKTNIGIESETKKSRLDFEKGNYDRFAIYMNRNWEDELMLCNGVDSMWKKLKQILLDGVRTFVPMIQQSNADKYGKKRRPLPETIRVQIREKNSLWKKYISGSVGEEEYKKQRNKVRNVVRRHVRGQQNKIALEMKTNPKKFWSYVNSKIKVKDKIGTLTMCGEDGHQREAVTDRDKAEALNRFFVSVFTKEPAGTFEEMRCGKQILCPMTELEISTEDIKKKLEKLNKSKSPGPDAIHPRILYELKNELIYPLFKIFNLSLTTGELPMDWKRADITAIYKKGKKSDVSNYRPISLTCIVCKIMESIVRDKIMKYFIENGLFTEKQFGFLRGRSTVTQLLQILDHWTELLENGGRVDVVYTDLEKAFDKVPHQRLLSKLKNYGIHNDALNWIRGFLTDRKQRVVLNGASSGWEDVLSGVPQGSVLGPLLFIVYINDLVDACGDDAYIYLFADDAKIYKHVVRVEDTFALQHTLDKFIDWTDKWLVKVNVNKCKAVVFCNRYNSTENTAVNYRMRQTPLESVENIKDLGVIFDKNLKFTEHVNDKVNKAYGMLGLIKRNFRYMSRNCLVMVYKAIVRSHLEYADAVWCPVKREDVDNLERVQKRFTKIIPELSHLAYSERLRELKLPTLVYRRIRGDMIELYKFITGKYDRICMPGLRGYGADVLGAVYETRGHRYKLIQRHCRYKLRQHFFIDRSVPIWNGLPDHVVAAESVNVFKARLDRFWASQDFVYDYKAQPEGTGSRSRNIYQ